MEGGETAGESRVGAAGERSARGRQRTSTAGRDVGQAALVVGCIAAVVLTLLAAPVLQGAAASGNVTVSGSPSDRPVLNQSHSGAGGLGHSAATGQGTGLSELAKALMKLLGGSRARTDGGGQAAVGTTGYHISVTPKHPSPGQPVAVFVSRGKGPAAGVPVAVNDEPIGHTDTHGTINFTAPYTPELNVTAGSAAKRPTANSIGPVAAGPSVWESHRAYDIAPPAKALQNPSPSAARNASQPSGGNRTRVTLETDMTFTRSGVSIPGRTVTYHVAINSTPVRNAAVRVDGKSVGRTSENGDVSFRIPPGTADGTTETVRVKRGGIEDSTRLTVYRPSVSVHSASWIPGVFPGRRAAVTVSAGPDPVPGAAVAVAGTPVGKTNDEGVVETALPLSPAVTVTAHGAGFSVRKTVWKPLLSVLIALLAVLGIAVGGGAVVYKTRPTPRRLATLVPRFARAFGARTVTLLIVLSTRLTDVGRALRERLRSPRSALEGVAALPAVLRENLQRLARWLRARYAAIRRQLLGVLPWISTEPPAVSGDASTSRAAGRSQPLVRRALRGLVQATRLTGWRTMTPAEIRDAALDAGFPDGPVTVVTDAFRDVEYGDRDEGVYSANLRDAAAAFTESRPEDASGAPAGSDQGGEK